MKQKLKALLERLVERLGEQTAMEHGINLDPERPEDLKTIFDLPPETTGIHLA